VEGVKMSDTKKHLRNGKKKNTTKTNALTHWAYLPATPTEEQ